MGTNYYLMTDVCPHCGRSEEKVHIGKSSAGWSFSFRAYKAECGTLMHDGVSITTTQDWRDILSGGLIMDEYDREISESDFWMMVYKKRGGRNHARWYPLNGNFVDEEGKSFSPYEFS
jgi:hypothetical protein